ncbi:MAG: ABC transporter substrate-binding protein [Thermoleophilia bacterium]
MKKPLGSLVLALVALAFVIGGCDKSTDVTPGSSGQTGGGSADTNGELVYATESMGDDNFYFLGGLPPAWGQLTNDRLIRYNMSSEAEGYYPMLAEKWEFSPDYSRMDIYLRQGVQWQGGYGELTADDVKFTLDQQADATKGSWQAWWWDPVEMGGFIESTDIVDKYHVRLNFSAPPYPAWLSDFSSTFMNVQCKSYVDEVGLDKAIQEPIGTGAWQLIEHVSGSYMKFERNDAYWGKKPSFKYLTIRSVPDKDAQIAMLKTGEVDLIGIPPAKIPEVEAAGLGIFSIPEATGHYVLFGGQLLASDPKFDPTVPWAGHTDEAPDSEWNQRALKVREALNLAIDREAIRAKIMQGAATPMSTYVWPPSVAGYKPEWADISFDTQRAKQLLTEAGYPNGFAKPITMYVDSGNTYAGDTGKEVALAVADELEGLGLNVERRMIDSNAFSNIWYSGREDAWCMSAMYLEAYPDPTVMWPWSLSSTGPTHEAFMTPEFDKIVADYNSSMTKPEAERIAIAQSGMDYIYNNYMFAPIAFESKNIAYGPKVGKIEDYEKYAQYSQPGVTFSYVTPSN